MFVDEATNKSKRAKPGRSSSSPEMTIADAIQVLVRAGYCKRVLQFIVSGVTNMLVNYARCI
jgi:hypothetical protein